MSNFKFLMFGVFIVVLQTTILAKVLSIKSSTVDFLTIYIILSSIKYSKQLTLKNSFILGLVQDLFSLNFMNAISKPVISFLVHALKSNFFVSNFWVRSFFVLLLSLVDYIIKNTVLFLKTGTVFISSGVIFYLFVNFLIFYLVYLLDEDFKV